MKKRLDALNLLDAVEAPDGDGYIYRATEVSSWYRIDEDALDELVDRMNCREEWGRGGTRICDDAYSIWCATNSGRNDCSGTDDEVRELGFIDESGRVVRTGTIMWFEDKNGIGHLKLRWEDGEKEIAEFPEPITAATNSDEVAGQFSHDYSFINHDGDVVHVGVVW